MLVTNLKNLYIEIMSTMHQALISSLLAGFLSARLLLRVAR
jgi:hypothetical protein